MSDMDSVEFMEVDGQDLQEQGLSLPDLDILKPSEDVRGRLPGWNIPATTTFSASPGKISLFPQKQAVVEECEKILLPPGPSESRRQQTNEPVCPQEFCPEELDDLAMGADSAAPGLEGFDYLLDEEDVNVLPVLSAADVEAALPGAILGDAESEDVFAPSVPSLQPAGTEIYLSPLNRRERRPTITLMLTAKEESLGCPSTGEIEQDIYHELMDDSCGISSDVACEHSFSPAPRAAVEEEADASRIPRLHSTQGSRGLEASTLRTAIFFCEEDGKRADPGQPRQYFRVADFSAVSEVWKRIKCNSSSDCTKNMKRAMRMSTTNDRHYFINLSQKLHRMQVFRFGERSLEHFKKVFPTAYQ
uniref:ETS domain-containing protein n=1 Tax=Macrostomum lignano TaxID=282301 RepID=A0A1I8J843_9PLAT